jgi:predicted NAD/FAD-binding protein
MSEKKIRVAVVGSGLAGLTAAYLITRDPEQRYAVTLFEEVSSQSMIGIYWEST